jgi:hypothetical protein
VNGNFPPDKKRLDGAISIEKVSIDPVACGSRIDNLGVGDVFSRLISFLARILL